VADSEVYGGRWVIALDDTLTSGLAAGDQKAVATWKRIAAAVTFFRQREDVRAYRPKGLLAVISDFRQPHRAAPYEALNLLPRRRVPAVVIEKSQAQREPFSGLLGIYYPDPEPPAPKLRQRLLSFAKGGGTLFTGAKSGISEGAPMSAEPYFAFAVRSFGKGRIAVLKEEEPDPYEVAADIQTMMGRGNDLLRFYNGTGMNCHYVVSPAGKKSLLHVLNYSRRPGLPAGLYVREKCRSAHFLTPEAATPAEIKTAALESGGMDIPLPPISSYGAIQLES